MDTISLHKSAKLLLILTCLSMCGCSGGVTVTLNDQAMYDPNHRLGKGQVASANLQGCINLTMQQQNLESMADVSVLSCPNSEVSNLNSIAVLSKLRFLDLANNAIFNITPLEDLINLSGVNLDNNQIREIGTLINLKTLTSASLIGNDKIPCQQLDALETKLTDNLVRPLNCL